MDWLLGLLVFCLGVAADLFRSVFMPASTDWINRFIPSARKKANVEENVLTLQIMETLKSLGKDPDLAKYAREDATQFMAVLSSQREAFVENAIEVIDSTYMTQTEMNSEAKRRSDVARLQMERSIVGLQRSGWLQEGQMQLLQKAQTRWESYAKAQAQFAMAEFEDGSMAPLIYSAELEAATIRRTGELTRTLEEMRERYDA